MGYYIDLKSIGLADFFARIKSEYLLPSQRILKENPDEMLDCLHRHGFHNLYDLQQALKTNNRLQTFARESGLPENYLVILRREINSFHPKANLLDDFSGIESEAIQKLKCIGIKNTMQLFDRVITAGDRKQLVEETGIKTDTVQSLTSLTDLSRIKWVGAAFARLLLESGFDSVEKVADADAGELFDELIETNKDRRYYKGKFGENDIALLVKVARDVPRDIQYS